MTGTLRMSVVAFERYLKVLKIEDETKVLWGIERYLKALKIEDETKKVNTTLLYFIEDVRRN